MNKQVTDFEILSEMFEILSRGWCKGGFAKSKKNDYVEIDSKNATQFCLQGAFERAFFNLGVNCDYKVLDKLCDLVDQRGAGSITSYNDAPKRTHAEVLALVRQAAEEVKKEEEK